MRHSMIVFFLLMGLKSIVARPVARLIPYFIFHHETIAGYSLRDTLCGAIRILNDCARFVFEMYDQTRRLPWTHGSDTVLASQLVPIYLTFLWHVRLLQNKVIATRRVINTNMAGMHWIARSQTKNSTFN